MRKYVAIAVTLLGSSFAAMGQQMTHEERVVRTTYAKLSFADEIRIILDAMNHAPDQWKADQRSADKELASRLEFQLSNFKVGPIREIEGRIISEVAGMPPDGDTEGILQVTPSTFNYTEGDASVPEWTLYAKVNWNKKPHVAFPGDGWPLAALLPLPEMNGPYDRYATYTVTATFQSKSRTYCTAALFGKHPDGTANVHFLDLISGSMTLDLLAKTDMSTAPFSKTHLRNVPFVRKWLIDNQQSCSVQGHGDVCCNTETKRCGAGTSPASSRRRPAFKESSNPYLAMAGFHPRLEEGSALYAMYQTSCSAFNTTHFYNHAAGGVEGHVADGGEHTFTATVIGTCAYADGLVSPGPCTVSCDAEASGTTADFGSLSGILPHFHVASVALKSGQAGGASSESCQGTAATSFVDCITNGCGVNVSINGSSNGIGATVTFANNALWSDQLPAQNDCPSKATVDTNGGTCSPTGSGSGFKSNQTGTGGDDTGCSPIIIDISGNGFILTSADNGVKFDIADTGIPVQISWTADSSNAFLVLDRDGSGTIANGAELFGNFTPQPKIATPNGFAALAVYDDPRMGGNGDGVIDAHDAIFSQLRLWVDANHDGICQPGELHMLPELGVYSISLDYAFSGRTDQYGNVFRYKAGINKGMRNDTGAGPTAYDVFLTGK